MNLTLIIKNNMKLQLSLKRKWFEMTQSGIKIEDYREINEYWFKRLVFQHEKVFRYTYGFDINILDKQTIAVALQRIVKDNLKVKMIAFKPFTHNIMTLGYPSKDQAERILTFEHAGIEIRTGNPEWGAEPNKLYFVIKHGKQIK
jgi:hypothetical protein